MFMGNELNGKDIYFYYQTFTLQNGVIGEWIGYDVESVMNSKQICFTSQKNIVRFFWVFC